MSSTIACSGPRTAASDGWLSRVDPSSGRSLSLARDCRWGHVERSVQRRPTHWSCRRQVLSLDLDELLTFADGASDLVSLASQPDVDVHTFGSAANRRVPLGRAPPHRTALSRQVEAPVECSGSSEPPPACAPPKPPTAPTCAGCADCTRCLRNHGRRKHLLRADRVSRANVRSAASFGRRWGAPPSRTSPIDL